MNVYMYIIIIIFNKRFWNQLGWVYKEQAILITVSRDYRGHIAAEVRSAL